VIIALILRDSRLWAKAIDYLALGIDRQERQPLIWFQLGCAARHWDSALRPKRRFRRRPNWPRPMIRSSKKSAVPATARSGGGFAR
jgi:hypothetical protein